MQAVVGAGISGLSAAWAAARRGHLSPVVLEAADRVGGWIKTESLPRSRGDGPPMQFELGPRSFRPRGNGVAALQLVEQLGLQDEVLAVAGEGTRRFVLGSGGRLVELAAAPSALLHPETRWLPLLALREAFLVPPSALEDESVHDFIARRFSQEVAESLADAGVAGIFAGDPRRLSIRSCLPAAWEAEQQFGSVVRGMGRAVAAAAEPHQPLSAWAQQTSRAMSVSFRGGMGALPTALAAALGDDVVRTGTPVAALEPLPGRGRQTRVVLASGEALVAERVVVTLPAAQAAALVPCADTAARMRALPTASVGMVNLGFASPDVLGDLGGFGYLVPSREDGQLLGVSWDSAAFPTQQPGATRITVMMGGARWPGVVDAPEEELVAMARDRLRRHMGIDEDPVVERASAHADCIPQYAVGHHTVVAGIRAALAEVLPGVEFAGNSWGGVGVADCISVGLSL